MMLLYSQAASFVGSPDAIDRPLTVGTEAAYMFVTPSKVPEDGHTGILPWHVTPLGQQPRKHIIVLGKYSEVGDAQPGAAQLVPSLYWPSV
jgi:hypothetical protein